MKDEKKKGVGIFWWIAAPLVLFIAGFWIYSWIKISTANKLDVIAADEQKFMDTPGFLAAFREEGKSLAGFF